MNRDVWNVLFSSLWDWGGNRTGYGVPKLVVGNSTVEWSLLMQYDYDWVDRMYIDVETIGG